MTAAQQADSRETARSRVLVVDDEPLIRDFMGRALAQSGFEVGYACNGSDGIRQAAASRYGLIVLDLVMPDLDGRAVLTEILRAQSRQAVLVVSCLPDVGTRVQCLELGAQDYLTKPFLVAEFVARVRARLRAQPLQEVLRAGGLMLDVGRLVADLGQGPVALTRLEFLLLKELMEHGGRSVAKPELLAAVWGLDFDPGSNVVDVCVRRLRSKLGFELIKTVRGEGYQLAC